MRIIGQINGVRIVILIDTGSTHNFVDSFVIAKAQIPVYHTPELLVKVANGEALCSKGITKTVEFQMQGFTFSMEFYVLRLGGCDVVFRSPMVEDSWAYSVGLFSIIYGF